MKKVIVGFSIVLYVFLSIFRFAGAGRDDTFLTLWAGEQLARGELWMNYNLERSEMSSSLLHTMIIAVIDLVFPEHLYFMNKVFGVLMGVVMLLTISRYYPVFMQDREKRERSWFFLTLFSLAIYPAWMYWNLGGLETPVQSWLFVVYVIGFASLLKRRTPSAPFWLVVVQCLYVLVRPEGFLIILLSWVCLIAYHWYNKKRWSLFCPWFSSVILPPLAFFLVLTATRYLFLGALFPNPVYAKVGARQVVSSNLLAGFQYLYGFYTSSPLAFLQCVCLIMATIVTVINFFKRANLHLPLAVSVAVVTMNHVFVVLVGGNWMEYFRFLSPVVPLLVLITVLLFRQAVRHVPGRQNVVHIAIVLVFTGLAIHNFASQQDRGTPEDDGNCALPLDIGQVWRTWSWRTLDEDLMQLNCAQKRDWTAIVPFIRDELPEVAARLASHLRIVTYQMGFFPYYVKHTQPDLDIRFIDTAGLIDIEVARLPLAKDSGGIVGYTRLSSILTGDAGLLSEYVLKHAPNLCYTMGMADADHRKLLEDGWVTVWQKPQGVVYINPGEQEARQE